MIPKNRFRLLDQVMQIAFRVAPSGRRFAVSAAKEFGAAEPPMAPTSAQHS
jgi:hypothetical protein